MITSKLSDFDFNCISAYISQIEERFPFAKVCSEGKSWCGRDIFSLTVGSGEKTVLFLGGMDGSKTLGSAMLLRFFERLCISLKNDLKISSVKTSSILREQRITVIPVVNPDGMQISFSGADEARNYKGLVAKTLGNDCHKIWKANARGVEPYLNFDFDFPKSSSHNKPLPFNNYGPSAESEAETKVITDFIRKRYIKHSLLLSDNGNKIIYSKSENNDDNALTAQIFKSISGFKTQKRDSAACKGNFCEWFQKEFHRPSFEFSFDDPKEIGEEYFSQAYQNAEELLMLSSII